MGFRLAHYRFLAFFARWRALTICRSARFLQPEWNVWCGLLWGINFIVQERRDQLIVGNVEASPLRLLARNNPENNEANEPLTAICRVATSSDIIDSFPKYSVSHTPGRVRRMHFHVNLFSVINQFYEKSFLMRLTRKKQRKMCRDG